MQSPQPPVVSATRTPQKVIFCGSDAWTEEGTVLAEISVLRNGDMILVKGDYPPGFSALVIKFATERRIPVKTFDVDFETHARWLAAPERNQRMIDEADRVVAFPLSPEEDTADFVKRAGEHRPRPLPVKIVVERMRRPHDTRSTNTTN